MNPPNPLLPHLKPLKSIIVFANPPINLFHITNINLICISENICDFFPHKDIAEMPRKEQETCTHAH
jgi:hypothetical protein